MYWGTNITDANEIFKIYSVIPSSVISIKVIVKEDWVARAVMHLVENERYVVEGAAAVTIAAIMAGLFPNLKGKK